MAHLRPAGRPSPLIVALSLSLLLGGQAQALTIAIRSSGSTAGLLAAQDSRAHGKETVSLVNARSLTPVGNLGLIAGEALKDVMEQELGVREASGTRADYIVAGSEYFVKSSLSTPVPARPACASKIHAGEA